jgi:endonuclease-3 related protein
LLLSEMSEKKTMMSPMQIYDSLNDTYGEPRWWSDDPYTVMVQSILVQNTNWSSVENVTTRFCGRLIPERIRNMDDDELMDMIRPCGFCKGKSASIQRMTEWFEKRRFDVSDVDDATLRKELLSIKGIGAETADVIMIFAFHRASFIIDAYTRRLLERLGHGFADDAEIRLFFDNGLKHDHRLYGWFHRYILDHCIERCRKIPVCDGCPFFEECGFILKGSSDNLLR